MQQIPVDWTSVPVDRWINRKSMPCSTHPAPFLSTQCAIAFYPSKRDQSGQSNQGDAFHNNLAKP
jgi:hypothetical protein